LIWIRPQHYTDYVNEKFFGIVGYTGQAETIDYYNQSFLITLSRFNLAPLYQPLALLFLLAGIVYLAKSGSLATAILLSIFISPVFWNHYLAVVYPILILLAYHYRRQLQPLILLALITLLISTHFPDIHRQPATIINSLIASHYFFGLVGLTLFQLVHESLQKNSSSRIAKTDTISTFHLKIASVVQWIEHRFPEPEMGVRFPPEALSHSSLFLFGISFANGSENLRADFKRYLTAHGIRFGESKLNIMVYNRPGIRRFFQLIKPKNPKHLNRFRQHIG
jgi:hypothetical protein